MLTHASAAHVILVNHPALSTRYRFQALAAPTMAASLLQVLTSKTDKRATQQAAAVLVGWLCGGGLCVSYRRPWRRCFYGSLIPASASHTRMTNASSFAPSPCA